VFAADGAVLGQAVHKLDGAVMLDLEAFGKLADGRPGVIGETLYGQKELVLLWLQAVLASGFGAELKVAADLVAEFGERAVFGGGKICWHSYIVARYK
jgi:hypothetical protein